MDLLKLKYFYTVAKHEHVTKASEELHVVQPAITKSIKLLEKEFGVPLLMRVGRNIKLTEYGVVIKQRLDGVFSVIENLDKEISQFKKENENTVKLNVLAASNVVLEAVVKYKEENPDTIFNLIQNRENEGCDITVTTNEITNPQKSAQKRYVIEEKILLAVTKSSKYADRQSVELKELKDEKFIYIAGSRPFRQVCDKICENAGFTPKITFESDSPVAVKNIISAEVGIGFWPEFSWGKVLGKEIKIIPIKDESCKRQIIIELHDNAFMSKHCEKFYKYLINFLNKENRR